MKELKSAKPEAAFEVYMKNRAKFGDSPAFFLDCAEFFAQKGDKALALQVLSNIAELELENPSLLRVLAHRLAQTERFDLAILTFEEVLKLRPEEPQSYRDLALVVAERAQKRLELAAKLNARSKDPKRAKDNRARATAEYTRAVDLLNEVVMGTWDGRFNEIELIALEELNAMIPKAKAAGVKEIPLDKRLIKPLDVDVRIVMTWHADNTDIDLWVIEPSGEKADYSHNRTTIGGLVSDDFTGGYGPEEYMVRRAMPGVYTVKANYYGSDAVKLLGAVTVQMDVFTNFGRENQQRKSVTVRLKEKEETVKIGEIEF
jgi:tetratricopeptide (TPR) repeat protein